MRESIIYYLLGSTHQEQFEVQCLAQIRFDMQTRGIKPATPDPQPPFCVKRSQNKISSFKKQKSCAARLACNINILTEMYTVHVPKHLRQGCNWCIPLCVNEFLAWKMRHLSASATVLHTILPKVFTHHPNNWNQVFQSLPWPQVYKS